MTIYLLKFLKKSQEKKITKIKYKNQVIANNSKPLYKNINKMIKKKN